ncbi:hypothetical protein ABC365_08150 [Brevundimonas sp. 3P9-tot-E]
MSRDFLVFDDEPSGEGARGTDFDVTRTDFLVMESGRRFGSFY